MFDWYHSVRLALLITLLSASVTAFGQTPRQIEDLYNVVRKNYKDEALADSLNQVALQQSQDINYTPGIIKYHLWEGYRLFHHTQDNEAAINVYQAGLHIAEDGNHYTLAGDLMGKMGQAARELNNLPKARAYFSEGIKTIKQHNGDSLVLAKLHNNYGRVLRMLNIYDSAYYHYNQSYLLKESLNQPKLLSSTLLNMGVMQLHVTDTLHAITIFKQCAQLAEKYGQWNRVLQAYINLANVHWSQNYYTRTHDSTRYYFALAKQVANELKPGIPYTSLLLLEGNLLKVDSQWVEAKTIYDSALSIVQRNGHVENQMRALRNIATWHRDQGMYQESIPYYESTLELTRKMKDLYEEEQALFDLALAHQGAGHLEEALELSLASLAITNKLKKAAITSRLYEANAKAKLSSKERFIAVLNLKLTKRLNTIARLVWGVLALSTLLILAIIFAAYWRQRQRRIAAEAANERTEFEARVDEVLAQQESVSMEAMITAQETERQRIAEDLHDRLGATLSAMRLHFEAMEEGLKQLQVTNLTQYEQASEMLDTVIGDVRQIAHNMKSGTLAKFGLVPALQQLADTLNKSGRITVEFHSHGMDNRLDAKTELELYRIVQELVNNTLKHAQAQTLTIQLTRHNGTLNLLVEDNGVGFDASTIQQKGDGMGLANLHIRAERLQAELHIDSAVGHGTTVSLDVPAQTR